MERRRRIRLPGMKLASAKRLIEVYRHRPMSSTYHDKGMRLPARRRRWRRLQVGLCRPATFSVNLDPPPLQPVSLLGAFEELDDLALGQPRHDRLIRARLLAAK